MHKEKARERYIYRNKQRYRKRATDRGTQVPEQQAQQGARVLVQQPGEVVSWLLELQLPVPEHEGATTEEGEGGMRTCGGKGWKSARQPQKSQCRYLEDNLCMCVCVCVSLSLSLSLSLTIWCPLR